MHIKTKQLTVSAMLLAVSVLLVYMGNVIESSTLFFLAAAAFGAGIIQREYGLKSGLILYILKAYKNFARSRTKRGFAKSRQIFYGAKWNLKEL